MYVWCTLYGCIYILLLFLFLLFSQSFIFHFVCVYRVSAPFSGKQHSEMNRKKQKYLSRLDKLQEFLWPLSILLSSIAAVLAAVICLPYRNHTIYIRIQIRRAQREREVDKGGIVQLARGLQNDFQHRESYLLWN